MSEPVPEYQGAEAYTPRPNAAGVPEPTGVANKIIATLEHLPGELRSTYTKLAHSGRLDQIEQLAGTLAHLVGQLPDEEAREAEYEDRLVGLLKAKQVDLDRPSGSNVMLPHDALERLRDADRNGRAA